MFFQSNNVRCRVRERNNEKREKKYKTGVGGRVSRGGERRWEEVSRGEVKLREREGKKRAREGKLRKKRIQIRSCQSRFDLFLMMEVLSSNF